MSRSQIARSCSQSAASSSVPRPPERVGEHGPSRPARARSPAPPDRAPGVPRQASGRSRRGPPPAAPTVRRPGRRRSSARMPRVGGGTTKAGPPYGCWRASSAANAGSLRAGAGRTAPACGSTRVAAGPVTARGCPSTRRRFSSSKTRRQREPAVQQVGGVDLEAEHPDLTVLAVTFGHRRAARPQ